MKKIILAVLMLGASGAALKAEPTLEFGTFSGNYHFASDSVAGVNKTLVNPVELGFQIPELPFQFRLRNLTAQDETPILTAVPNGPHASQRYGATLELNAIHHWKAPLLRAYAAEGDQLNLLVGLGLGVVVIDQNAFQKSVTTQIVTPHPTTGKEINIGGPKNNVSYSVSPSVRDIYVSIPAEVSLQYKIENVALTFGYWATVSKYQFANGVSIRFGML